jgi:hypothetical protein
MGASASVWMWRAQVSTSSRVRTMNGRFLTPIADFAGGELLRHNTVETEQRIFHMVILSNYMLMWARCVRTWLLQDALQRLQGVLEHMVRTDVHLQTRRAVSSPAPEQESTHRARAHCLCAPHLGHKEEDWDLEGQRHAQVLLAHAHHPCVWNGSRKAHSHANLHTHGSG